MLLSGCRASRESGEAPAPGKRRPKKGLSKPTGVDSYYLDSFRGGWPPPRPLHAIQETWTCGSTLSMRRRHADLYGPLPQIRRR